MKNMESPENEKKTILVVDDEESIRDTIRIHLEREGYKVLTSVDGRDAIDTLKKDDVSMVITDIKMPRLDGFGVLDFAKENFSYVPVVMLTGYIDVSLAVDAMKKGSFHYLTKPVRKKDLIAAVEDALNTVESDREAKSFRISQLYLLAEGGLAIYHNDQDTSRRFDSDIFGSMLTAVRMFIESSFAHGESGEKSFEYGDSKILIEDGNDFFLVVIGTGRGVSAIKERMKRAVKRIERKYGEKIATWCGNIETFSGVESDLVDLLELANPNEEIAERKTQDSDVKLTGRG